MKRLFLVTILSAAMLGAMAGNPTKLFDEFKDTENTEYVKVPRFLLWLAKAKGSLNDVPLAGNISGVKVLSIECAANKTKNNFDRRLREETADYDELINVKDDDSRVRIFTRTDGNKFNNLYIFTVDDSDYTFIELSGRFTTDDIRKIAENQ